MKTSGRIFLALLIITGYFSCTKDIIEPNISDKTITLISPQNNDSSTILTHLFWWEEVEDALAYNLQIVKPDFASVQQLILDSNVTKNKFSVTLMPGVYQWRVAAMNGSSATSYSEIRTLTIDSTVNLSNQTVLLVSPANNYVTNVRTQTFRWSKLYNAEEYRFQVINQSNSTLIDVILTTDSAKYNLSDGQYTWQVRAQNATSNSLYSSRTITVDSTGPTASIPLYPGYGDTITSPDTLIWTRNAATVADSLFIYADSLSASPPIGGGYYQTSPSPSYIFTGAIGDYFWRLKSKDAAGNWSALGTTKYKFWVK